MKIANSTVALESQHASVEQRSVRETLRMWHGSQRPDFEGRQRGASAAVVTLSESARAAQADEAQAIQDSAEEAQNDPKVQLILRMVEAFTGRKIELVSAAELQPDPAARQRLDDIKQASPAQPPQPAGWGIEYDRQETLYQAEQTRFTAEGVIRTADGKEIAFTLELAMHREYYEESSVSLRAGDAVRKDPLVINFSGTAAQLTDTKFAFDLDSDGRQEQVSFVGPGSGFLALDSNGNGRIDSGSELFGAQSGNGFADLARYDSDGNHWIDENDAVYDKLRVWSKDASGKDMLGTLAQRGVGALYLGNVTTPFSLNAADNTNHGMVRSSGVYLNENGSAGTLQQVDLTV